jgi:GT2 family glycosyltransferase
MPQTPAHALDDTGARKDPGQPEMAASVIIPHYNDPVHLREVLDRLEAQAARLRSSAAVEILVVDNGSTVDLAPLQRAHPSVRWLVEPQKGAANARNRGVAASRAGLFAFIDSDCIPADDWLETALACARGPDIVGGRVDTHDESPPPRSGAEAFERVFAFNQKAYVMRMGFTGAGNFVVKKQVFEAVGPFVHGVSEDKDWCLRAGRLGYRIVYADNLVVSHPTRPDWPSLRRKWARLTEESFGLAMQAPLGRLRWFARSFLVLASIPVHAVQLLLSPRLDTSGERLRGTATLVAIRMRRFGWMLRQALTGEARTGG